MKQFQMTMPTLSLVLFIFTLGYGSAQFRGCSDLPGKCVCNQTSVACDGEQAQKIPDAVLAAIANRREHLETVSLTDYDLQELPLNVLGSCQQGTSKQYPYLVSLDLSRNRITSIHGQTFHCMPELITLNLSHNQWFVNGTTHTGVFSNLYALTTLDLTNSFHEMLNGTIHIINFPKFLSPDMDVLRTLKLGSNEFWKFPKSAGDALCQLRSLEELDLSANQLMDTGFFELSNCMDKIKSIDLSNNRFTSLSKTTRQTFEDLHKHPEIFLDNNKWNCDCHITDFRNWLKTTQVDIRNKKNFKCQDGYPTTNVGELVLDIDASKLKCPVPKTRGDLKAFYVVMGIIFALTAVIVMAAAYVKRAALKSLFLRCTKPIRGGLTTHSQYSYFTVQHEQV